MTYLIGDMAPWDLDDLINNRLGAIRTPEQFGCVADFAGDPLTATDNAVKMATAITTAAAEGALLLLGGRYFCSSLPTFTSLDIDWRAAGDAALVFPSGVSGVVINQDDYQHITRIQDLMFFTLGQESGTGLYVSYTAADSFNNRHLPRCWLVDVVARGFNTSAHGWIKGIVVKDVHAAKIIRPQVTGRRDTASTNRAAFGKMTAGIEYTSATGLTSIPSDVLIDAPDVANAQDAIYFNGDIEGPTVRGGKLVGVWRGINDQQATLRPGGQYIDNHINFFDFGINAYQRPQAQIGGNLFYKMAGATAAATSVKLDYCDLSTVGENTHINSGTDWNVSGDFIGVEVSNSVDANVEQQVMTRANIGVRLTNGTQRARVKPAHMSGAGYTNAPSITAAEDLTVNPNAISGRVAEGTNAAGVTLLSTLTTIKTISAPIVYKGERYLVTGTFEATKGGTAGNVVSVMTKTAGTSTVVFGSNGTQAKASIPALPASTAGTVNFSSEITVTGTGTLDISLQALSAGSDSTIAANNAQITLRRLRSRCDGSHDAREADCSRVGQGPRSTLDQFINLVHRCSPGGGGRVVKGLANRRTDEYRLCMTGL